MDLGTPFQTLERVFTEFNVGRLLYLLTLFGTIVFINYEAGFTHHYDVSYQIDEIERLQGLVTDSIDQKHVDVLREGVIEEMKARQTSIPDRLANSIRGFFLESLVRALAVSAGFLLYFIYSIIPSTQLEDKRSQAIGSGAITIVLIFIGYIFPDVGGLGGTAASLIGVQFVAFFVLAAYGNWRK
ncbi:hypothetical protein CRI94_11785 [Longibacter salinarum]|uniref:Uncharacterized protein n=1 Tax=Longibacter salinarum TaxID=1850348 RepID=A0A2A8CX79_9BACT|nr:hypothetical protein [Longibacter salinarum]PEN13312.1 hypothetical protein CRI94_11785 [Longibacter salinarum]